MNFDDFLRAELSELTRFSGALAGDRHLAEDILSDALLKVAVRWRRVSAMDDPAAYVRRVIVTTYLSDRRKTRRRQTVLAADVPSVEPPARTSAPPSSQGTRSRDCWPNFPTSKGPRLCCATYSTKRTNTSLRSSDAGPARCVRISSTPAPLCG